MDNAFLNRYLVAAVMTVVIEGGVLFIWFRGRSWGRVLGTLLLGNALTHPVVNNVFPWLVPDIGLRILSAELFAVLVEAVVIAWLLKPKPLYVALSASAAANMASFFIGLPIMEYLIP